ncbi:MAG TPA: hypothetical protein VFP94_07855, partial [Terriglobales bacterium]|nr:hypothetical protein [Terriglobales bacterium]
WGVVTALGMLRMRFWALVSTLVFAYGLLWGGGAVATAAITAPVVATGPAAAVMLRLMLGGISMTGLGIAIWFLAYGGRQAVRAQFLGGRVWRTRPLSVSLLGWAFGVGACLATPLILLVSRPVLPLGPVHLIGAFAKAGFVLLAGIALAAAVGLLRLRPWGRTAGLVIIAVLLVSVASDLAPSTRFRSELGAALAGPGAYGANLAGSYWWLDSLGMVITLLLGGYFLYSRRSAFYRPPALLARDETALTR